MTIRCVVFGCEQLAVNCIRYINTLEDVNLQLVVTYEVLTDSLYEYESVIEETEKLGTSSTRIGLLTNTTQAADRI